MMKMVILKEQKVSGELIGKFSRRCDMCHDYKMNGEFYKWVGIITKTELTICKKCAKREGFFNGK